MADVRLLTTVMAGRWFVMCVCVLLLLLFQNICARTLK